MPTMNGLDVFARRPRASYDGFTCARDGPYMVCNGTMNTMRSSLDASNVSGRLISRACRVQRGQLDPLMAFIPDPRTWTDTSTRAH